MALREAVSSIPDTGSKKDYIVLLVPFEKLRSHISLKQTKKKTDLHLLPLGICNIASFVHHLITIPEQ